MTSNFPVLQGRRITNTREFKDALVAASADLLAGRISVKDANAINREANDILKVIQAALWGRSVSRRFLSKLWARKFVAAGDFSPAANSLASH